MLYGRCRQFTSARAAARELGTWALFGAVFAGCADGQRHRAPPPPTPSDTSTSSDSDEPAPDPTDTAAPGPTDTGPFTLAITDLTSSPNPNSVLSMWLTWRTAVPSTSEVKVEGDLRFVIADEALVRDHRVLVFAMHAEETYTLTAVSRAADGTRVEAATEWTAGVLPREVPVMTARVLDADRVQPGWTLVNLGNTRFRQPPTAAIYDRGGRPIWYAIPGTHDDERGDVAVSLADRGHVLVGQSGGSEPAVLVDLAGDPVWTGLNPHPALVHHDIKALADGSFVFLQFDLETMPGLRSDAVVQVDRANTVLWDWKLLDHLTPPPDAGFDWSHCNSLTFPETGDFYVNSPKLGFFRVDRATGDIAWNLGVAGDFAPDPDHPSPWPLFPHDPEVQPNGNVLFYDNGLKEVRPWTRVLELAIDEVAMTTEVVWEYPGRFDVPPWYRDDWFTHIYGDADRLPNGNTLVTAGSRISARGTRVFEVTADGALVWEMIYPSTDESTAYSYRAERIDPLVEVLAE